MSLSYLPGITVSYSVNGPYMDGYYWVTPFFGDGALLFVTFCSTCCSYQILLGNVDLICSPYTWVRSFVSGLT